GRRRETGGGPTRGAGVADREDREGSVGVFGRQRAGAGGSWKVRHGCSPSKVEDRHGVAQFIEGERRERPGRHGLHGKGMKGAHEATRWRPGQDWRERGGACLQIADQPPNRRVLRELTLCMG
ncbi:hypothetical protein GOP47_0027997, partial [Adiantum capillus-veneris]